MRVIGVLLLLASACSNPPPTGGNTGPCTTGSTRCNAAGEVGTCSGGEYAYEACPDQLVCFSGNCVDPSTVCTPEAIRCDLTGRRERCNAQGNWELDRCPQGSACLEGGTCADRICDPGQRRCVEPGQGEDPQRQRCADDGLAWQADACRRGERCIGDGICQRMRCQPRNRGCADERTPATCSDDGMEWVADEACPPAHRCTGSGRCVSACEEARARQSYDGCEFFAVDLPQIGEASRRQDQHPYAVVIANPHDEPVHVSGTRSGDQAVELVASQDVGGITVYSDVRNVRGEVQRVSGTFERIEVPPQGVGTFILPSDSAGTVVSGNTVSYVSEKAARAYRLRTDLPVTAYQFQPLCCNISYTNDASILIPVGSQGRQFLGVSAPHNVRPGFLAVVGSENPAEVTIDLSDRQVSLPQGMSLNNGQLQVNLAPYEVLTLMTSGGRGLAADLTGVRIDSSAEIGVFGGHVCTQIPDGTSACDHLETSVMAVETWRNEAVAAHTFRRSDSPNEMNYYRIIAANDGTQIYFEDDFASIRSGDDVMRSLPACSNQIEGDALVLDAGQWCGFASQVDFVVRSNRAFQLVQMISGQSSTESGGLFGGGPDHAGDPAMTTVPPTDQYRSEYTFLTPQSYHAQYVNVVHPPGAIIELDGITMNSAAMGGDRLPQLVVDDQPVGRGDAWRLSTIKVSAGNHQIMSMTGDTFGLMVYAYDDYVSYAYPGGMNLEKR